jgi:hypothetical protein
LTLVPLGIVALITVPSISGFVSFLNAASTENLLAIAFIGNSGRSRFIDVLLSGV